MIGFPKTLTDISKSKNFSSVKAPWLAPIEKQAESYLSHQDFFSKKTEDWKYFPFQKIMKQNFVFEQSKSSISINEEDASFFPSSFKIHIKNGKPFPLFKQHKDLLVYSWKDFMESKVSINSEIQKKIQSTFQKERNPFCSFNNVFFEDGFILIIKGKLKETLEIHYLQSDENDLQGLNIRNFIFLEKESSAKILEIFHPREEAKPLFLNIQTDCFSEKKTKLEHIRIDKATDKDILINQLFAHLSKESQTCFFSLSLSAGISRYLSHLEQEEKSISTVRGLSLLGGTKYTDHKVDILHKGIEGVSHQLYKSFLFDTAKQIFQGFISIEQQAQKSETSQLSKNFLFNKGAVAVAVPKLDVRADNVKAEHGATISPFTENKDLLFYLQSRGIDSLQAFHLVLSSLIEEVFSCLTPQTKEALKPLLTQNLNSLRETYS